MRKTENKPFIENGLVITKNNVKEFLKGYKGGNHYIDEDSEYLQWIEDVKNGKKNIDEDYDVQLVLEDMGFDVYCNLEGAFTRFKGNMSDNGYMYLDEFTDVDKVNIDVNDYVMIMFLEKDSLFMGYTGLDEIYKELETRLKDLHIEVSREFLENSVGRVSAIFID